MEDQGRFLEMLQEIKDIAAAQDNKMTMDEIKRYLGDMQLEGDRLEAVYHYLGASGINIQGYRYAPTAEELAARQSINQGFHDENASQVEDVRYDVTDSDGEYSDGASSKKSVIKGGIESLVKASEGKAGRQMEDTVDVAARNRQLYMDEVRAAGTLTNEKERQEIKAFLQGECQSKDRFISNRLTQVMNIAEGYRENEAVKNGIVTIDDLTAEGNMGLMIAVNVLEENKNNYILGDGTPDYAAIDGTIEMEIRTAIEGMIDDTTWDKDWEQTVLAKTNLLNEATKYMVEQIGRIPTSEELSEYTKLPVSEIRSILELSKL